MNFFFFFYAEDAHRATDDFKRARRAEYYTLLLFTIVLTSRSIKSRLRDKLANIITERNMLRI